MPQQICIECYNIFSKMALFRQICKRSKRALHKICDFTTKQLQSIKAEGDIDVFYGSEIVDIKVRVLLPLEINSTEIYDIENFAGRLFVDRINTPHTKDNFPLPTPMTS